MARLTFGGGLNEADNTNADPQECIEGQNFKLEPRSHSFRPRDPLDKVLTTANGSQITGLLQLIKRDDSQTQIVVAGTTAYQWDGSATTVSAGDGVDTVTSTCRLRGEPWILDQLLCVTDLALAEVVHKWDGTDFEPLLTGLTSGSTKAVSSLTCAGSTATAISSSHGFATDNLVTIAGANETEYNGQFLITVSDADTFTYTMSCSTSPATGTITADKAPDLYAKYARVFNGRMWLFNIQLDSTATPHGILASAFEDVNSYDTSQRPDSGLTGTEAILMLTPDLKPINLVIEIAAQLVISTSQGRLFKLTGTSAQDYSWEPFFVGSAAVGQESGVNTGNDVMYMRQGGAIDLLSSTERFGDVSADDASAWIPDTTSGLGEAIAVYDQQRQQVMFFVEDSDSNGKVLVYDKEAAALNPRLSPWTVYTTLEAHDFKTEVAAYLRRAGTSSWSVHFGDDSGNLYNLCGCGEGDSGSTNIDVYRKTPLLDADEELLHFRVIYRRIGAFTLEATLDWPETFETTFSEISLKGPVTQGDAYFWGGDAYWGGSYYWNGGTIISLQLNTTGFTPGGRAPRMFLNLRASTTVKFVIEKLLVGET